MCFLRDITGFSGAMEAPRLLSYFVIFEYINIVYKFFRMNYSNLYALSLCPRIEIMPIYSSGIVMPGPYLVKNNIGHKTYHLLLMYPQSLRSLFKPKLNF